MSRTPSLSELQAWLTEQLVKQRALEKDPAVVAQAAAALTGNDRLLPVEQLEIYREQFWLRHTGALLEDFPGLSGILGQSEWEKLSESYLARYPCSSFTLRDLGQHMPEHVAKCADLPHPTLCLDMARLEWAYVEIFDAADAAPLDAARLSQLGEDEWPNARIALGPAVRLLQVSYPVVRLRQALRDEHNPHAVPIPEPQAQALLLFRDAARGLRHRVLSPLAFSLLESLARGLPLAQAAETTAREHPGCEREVEAHVGAWFADWTALGVIADVLVGR